MLSNNLTNDEKDSVRDELLQLQADIVCVIRFYRRANPKFVLSFERQNQQRVLIYLRFRQRIQPKKQA